MFIHYAGRIYGPIFIKCVRNMQNYISWMSFLGKKSEYPNLSFIEFFEIQNLNCWLEWTNNFFNLYSILRWKQNLKIVEPLPKCPAQAVLFKSGNNLSLL